MARDRQQVVGGPEGVLGRRNRWAGAAQHRRAEQSPRDVSRWLGQGGGPTLSAGVSQGRQWFPGHAEKNSKGKQSSGPEGKGVDEFSRHGSVALEPCLAWMWLPGEAIANAGPDRQRVDGAFHLSRSGRWYAGLVVAGRRSGLGRARYHVVQNEEGRMAPGWDVAGHNKRGGLHKLCDGPRCPEFRSPT